MAVCGAAIAFLGAVDAAGAAAPAYVTPIMAHTAWTATENCQPVAGVATLPTVLSGHGAEVVVDRHVRDFVDSSDHPDLIEPMALSPFPKPIQMPSWADLKTYRAKYPAFDLASASRDYTEMTSLTMAQQKAEACDSKTRWSRTA